jgi:monoamine oxidase
MRFNNPFWKQWDKELSFLLTDEIIPTWWTQYPQENNLLTGWLGGPRAEKMSKKTSAEIAGISTASLASIFQVTTGFLDNELLHYRIFCWSNQEYVDGGYSFETLQSDKAKEKLSIPINDTVFVAGEALHQGESQGTVEAALKNGKDAAKKIINSLSR